LNLAEHHATGFHYRWFSDNVSLSVPISDSGSLELALRTAAQMQVEFILRGLFLRGAATVGPHYHSADVDYGPALTEAAETERVLSRVPRIVLSDSLVVRLRLAPELRSMALVDRTDGRALLNFLQFLDISGYKVVKKHIRDALDQAGSDSVLHKYQWLAGYFNYSRGRREFKTMPPLDLAPL